MTKRTRNLAVIAALAALVLLAACTSRYRLDLFEIRGDETRKIKVEKTEYVIDGVLNTPYERDKIVPGQGNCIVLYTGARGESGEVGFGNLMGYDAYLQYRVFLQLPSRPEVTTYNLSNNAFVQLLGRYEASPEENMYLGADGTLAIDSIPKHRLFGTIDGTFKNAAGDQVKFRGQFKVKISE
jgi:hypothetical protein